MSFESDIVKFAKSLADRLNEKKIQAVRLVLAAESLEIIRRRVRSGRGITGQLGSIQRLKPLSKSYIQFRRRNARRLSGFTTPTKSNLTFSNQMLGSMDVIQQGQRMFVGFRGRRAGGKTNQQIAEYVAKDRPFMFLSPQELDQAQRRAIRTFEDLVKGV